MCKWVTLQRLTFQCQAWGTGAAGQGDSSSLCAQWGSPSPSLTVLVDGEGHVGGDDLVAADLAELWGAVCIHRLHPDDVVVPLALHHRGLVALLLEHRGVLVHVVHLDVDCGPAVTHAACQGLHPAPASAEQCPSATTAMAGWQPSTCPAPGQCAPNSLPPTNLHPAFPYDLTHHWNEGRWHLYHQEIPPAGITKLDLTEKQERKTCFEGLFPGYFKQGKIVFSICLFFLPVHLLPWMWRFGLWLTGIFVPGSEWLLLFFCSKGQNRILGYYRLCQISFFFSTRSHPSAFQLSERSDQWLINPTISTILTRKAVGVSPVYCYIIQCSSRFCLLSLVICK